MISLCYADLLSAKLYGNYTVMGKERRLNEEIMKKGREEEGER